MEKNILITGASAGIGRAIAAKLAEGANLFLLGRNIQELEKTKSAVMTAGARSCEIVVMDISKTSELTMNLSEIFKDVDLDILINNAGVWQKVGELDSLRDDKVLEIINTNLTAQILISKYFYDKMKNTEDAKIINIISQSGIRAQEGQSVYAASKYGMHGFSDVLRADVKNYPLRVGAVYQSGTNTEMFKKAGDDWDTSAYTEPEDLAEVVKFMLTRPQKLWINELWVTK